MFDHAQKRLFPLAALALLLIFSGLALFDWQSSEEAFRSSLEAEANQLRNSFTLTQQQTEQMMLAAATIISHEPDIQRMFLKGRDAVFAEGGGGGGKRAARVRADMLAHVQTSWEQMQNNFGARQLHFHLAPGSLSFLRVHTPNKFGDRMDDLRHIIVDVNADQKPRTGFETGRIYSGIRGVVPVFAKDDSGNNVHVGALEAGTAFDVLLNSLDKELDSGVAAVLQREHIENKVWQEFLEWNGERVVGECECYLEASSRPFAMNILRHAKFPRYTAGVMHSPFVLDERYYNAVRFPLRDYLGSKDPSSAAVGYILMWTDRTEAYNALQQGHHKRLMFFGLGLSLSWLAVWLLMNFATRRLQQRIIESAKELTQERRFHESLIEVLPHSMVVTDTAGTIVDVNSMFTQISGYTRDEVIGRKTGMLKSGLTPSSLYQDMWQTIASGQVWRGELQNRRKNGELYWDSVSIAPVTDDQDKTIYYVSLQRDITERKQVEQELLTTHSRLMALMENMHGAVLVEDEGRHVVLVNQNFCDLFAIPVSPQALIGVDCAKASEQSKQRFRDPERFAERIDEILANRQLVTGDVLEMRDGRFLERSYVPIVTTDGYAGHFWQYYDISERVRAEQELRLLATTDTLTGLANRRHFIERAEIEFARYMRMDESVGLLLLDLDYFKLINDTCGHAAGDDALRQVAALIQDNLRRVDLAARFGGEEFVVLLPGAGMSGCQEVAERIRRGVEALELRGCEGARHLTVSIGITLFDESDSSVDMAISRADTAMYTAKKDGRNRVVSVTG